MKLCCEAARVTTELTRALLLSNQVGRTEISRKTFGHLVAVDEYTEEERWTWWSEVTPCGEIRRANGRELLRVSDNE